LRPELNKDQFPTKRKENISGSSRDVQWVDAGDLNTWLLTLTSMLDGGDSKRLFSISSCLSFSVAFFNAEKEKKGKIAYHQFCQAVMAI
jgi:hypothetical protein